MARVKDGLVIGKLEPCESCHTLIHEDEWGNNNGLCNPCEELRQEAAWERLQEELASGEGPLSLDEQHKLAYEQKYGFQGTHRR